MTTSVKGVAPRIRRAHLAGPSRRLDPRIHALRPDLVDVSLAAIVAAPRYAEAVRMSCGPVVTMLHAAADANSLAASSLLPGEGFAVFDLSRGWAWGQCCHDGYVGWLRAEALVSPAAADHRITVPTASIFAAPSIKAAVVATLPLNAQVAADGSGSGAAGDFCAVTGGFVHCRHLARPDAADPVALALGFIGSPYVWGGRTRDGIDCSGLSQAVLMACGVTCPRDSDQQGEAFPVIDRDERRRGDLVFFPGHVAILADRDTLIHANAFWMATVVEPLAVVAARLAPTGFCRPA